MRAELYRVILLKTQDEDGSDWWSAKMFLPGRYFSTNECDSLEGAMSEVLKAREPGLTTAKLLDFRDAVLASKPEERAHPIFARAPGVESAVALREAMAEEAARRPASKAQCDLEVAQLDEHGKDYTHAEMKTATELCYESQAATALAEMVEQLLEFVVHVESLRHAADCSPCSSPTCILGHQAAKVLGR